MREKTCQTCGASADLLVNNIPTCSECYKTSMVILPDGRTIYTKVNRNEFELFGKPMHSLFISLNGKRVIVHRIGYRIYRVYNFESALYSFAKDQGWSKKQLKMAIFYSASKNEKSGLSPDSIIKETITIVNQLK